MERAEAVARVLSGAYQFLDFTEQGGDNHGQVVETFLKLTGNSPGDPWCAAFVSFVGWRALLNITPTTLKRASAWPLPRTAGCKVLGDFAAKQGILMGKPEVGDVFLKYYASKRRFAHTGFVLSVLDDGTCLTLEGNTNQKPEERNGWGVFIKKQHFKVSDRFVRWQVLIK